MAISFSRRRLLQMTASTCAASRFMHGGPASVTGYGALPSRRQLLWHARELTAFLHFGINTFTDKEWGYGDDDPALFNPTQFDAGAIVAALKAGGMKAVILTCKHHDGFCLWPTHTTNHHAHGDFVKAFSEAARRAHMKFGVYVSPWDRNHAEYGRPAYIAAYREQLRELLTNYGAICEVWFDGANGGDGYYGGAREKRTIDRLTYYDWPETWAVVRKLQPNAVIFSDVGPDVRWVGNERGEANETCWATYDPVGPDGGEAAPGFVRDKDGQTGTRGGKHWMPAECDVSIRPGWFWHEKENSRVKTARQLMDLYYKSVGRGANLLLNVPPDRRGLIDEHDAAALREFGALLRGTFGHAVHANEGFNVIRLREDITKGQRVVAFEVDAQVDGSWRTIATGTSIGARRILRLEKLVVASKVRATPGISEVSLFREPQA
jgi:alpha-L-fucosidase